MPYAVAVMQVFSHRPHHRDQVTTRRIPLGAELGPTDQPVMSGWQ